MKKASIDLGKDSASNYCHCMLDRIMKKYPDAAKARYIRFDTTIATLAKDCLKQ